MAAARSGDRRSHPRRRARHAARVSRRGRMRAFVRPCGRVRTRRWRWRRSSDRGDRTGSEPGRVQGPGGGAAEPQRPQHLAWRSAETHQTGRTIRRAGGRQPAGGARIKRSPAIASRSSRARPIAARSGCRARTATAGSSSSPDGSRASCRPAARVDPSHAPLMPKLVASGGSVIDADPGAHHYRLVGLEIAPADGVFLDTLVAARRRHGDADGAAAPHHHRPLLPPRRSAAAARGAASRSTRAHAAVIDSYFSDFKEVGADSQAIAGWNGPGPFRIANNYLEAAGENVMFGGADPAIPDLVPADIEIARQPLGQAAALEDGRPPLRRHRVGGQEPVRAEERAARARSRATCSSTTGRTRRTASPSCSPSATRTAARRGRSSKTSPSRTTSSATSAAGINMLGRDDNHPSQPDAAHRDPQQRVSRRRRRVGPRAAVPAARRHQRRDHRPQHGASDRQHRCSAATRAAHGLRLPEQHRAGTTTTASAARAPAPGSRRSQRYFPGAVVRRNVIVGGERRRAIRRTTSSRRSLERGRGAHSWRRGEAIR